MSRWYSRKAPQVDIDEMNRVAEESLEETRSRQPHVNALTSFLNNRTGRNGFGEDFDITFTPRSAA